MLTILIPTHPGRELCTRLLVDEFERQKRELNPFNYDNIIIESDPHPTKSIGEKRNDMLAAVKTKYFAFFDSDDRPSRNYLKLIYWKLTESYPDCCSLTGVITWDGENPEIFEHSIKYKEWKTNPEGSPVRYERYPNHLNVIKTEIGKQFKFPEINHGEDTDWATQIFKSGLLKKEAWIDGVMYHYDYKTKK